MSGDNKNPYDGLEIDELEWWEGQYTDDINSPECSGETRELANKELVMIREALAFLQ